MDDSIIISTPDIGGVTPVFRGTRVPIKTLFDYLSGGDPLDEFLDDFPSVSREVAIQLLQLAEPLAGSIKSEIRGLYN